jgi:hypothetical protein
MNPAVQNILGNSKTAGLSAPMFFGIDLIGKWI